MPDNKLEEVRPIYPNRIYAKLIDINSRHLKRESQELPRGNDKRVLKSNDEVILINDAEMGL